MHMTEPKGRLRAAFEEMRVIGQGILEVHIYGPESFLLTALKLGGDTEDLRLDVSAAEYTINEILDETRQVFCLLCEARLGPRRLPRRLAVIRPSVDAMRASGKEGLHIVANGICLECDKAPDLPGRITAYYQNVLPGVRSIAIPSKAGSA
jgi:hypothetical protein